MNDFSSYLNSPALQTYKELLLKWQKAVNLVAPSTLKDVDKRHFLDSLQILPLLPVDKPFKLVDMGSGAGFPGVVIACVCPNADVHLIESDQKKAIFMQTVSRETNVSVTVHNKRIEDVNMDGVDVVSARALSSLDELFSYSSKFKPEKFIFLKGENADKEIKEATYSWDFNVKTHKSVTDKQAKILEITDLIKKS